MEFRVKLDIIIEPEEREAIFFTITELKLLDEELNDKGKAHAAVAIKLLNRFLVSLDKEEGKPNGQEGS